MADLRSGTERRASERIPIHEFVEITSEPVDEPIRALALNLSDTGLAVVHCLAGAVGDRIRCRLLFTPHEPLEILCRVVWLREATAEQSAAMGLRFEELPAESSSRLALFLSRLRTHSEPGTLASVPIDPFCEPGTWRDDHALDTFDEYSTGSGRPGGQYFEWKPPPSVRRKAAKASMSLKLVLLVVLGSMLGTLAIWIAAHLMK
jgi:hypothetical protein